MQSVVRKHILEALPTEHSGIVNMKAVASFVYLSRLNEELKSL